MLRAERVASGSGQAAKGQARRCPRV